MIAISQILFFAQIAVAVIVIILIAVQQRGTALGSAFGGGGEFYATKRGLQKKLHYITIAMVTIFIILGILNVVL